MRRRNGIQHHGFGGLRNCQAWYNLAIHMFIQICSEERKTYGLVANKTQYLKQILLVMVEKCRTPAPPMKQNKLNQFLALGYTTTINWCGISARKTSNYIMMPNWCFGIMKHQHHLKTKSTRTTDLTSNSFSNNGKQNGIFVEAGPVYPHPQTVGIARNRTRPDNEWSVVSLT